RLLAKSNTCSGQITAIVQSLPNSSRATQKLGQSSNITGKRNFEGRDKAAETAVKVQKRCCRDRTSLNNPALWGVFGENREISVRPRVRGGGCSRYRTSLPIPPAI